ncbi:MAG: ATP-binding protein, partial [Mangrovibacterium sp.]
TWILRDKDEIEKDYEHFFCPLILSVKDVAAKIRILKYRYLQTGTIFPQEVDQYDPYIIREALNNCIAHQDYTKGGRIVVVESERSTLSFLNSGSFIPQSVESVVLNNAPENNYRNPLLAQAMVSLNMIDTIGSGIRKMFSIQKNKYFPLPDYNFSNGKVLVTFRGFINNIDYAQKIAQMPELSFEDVILLDNIAKNKTLDKDAIRYLRKRKLIEGRLPHVFISSKVAKEADDEAEYIKNKGLNDSYYKQLIVEYLQKFKRANRTKIDALLLDKLPDVLNDQKKENKVKTLLTQMRKEGIIKSAPGKYWVLCDNSEVFRNKS